MHLRQEKNGCWQATLGDIHMGCTLSLDELAPFAPRILKQVHGVAIHDDAGYDGSDQQGDGLVSDCERQALVVKTADCVPLTITDGVRIGAIHAGWRGTAAGVVKRLSEYFHPRRTHVVIGPAISAANYEVDADLYTDWLQREPVLARFLTSSPQGGSKRQLDLKGFVRHQLLGLGVPERQIETIPVCTYASALPSYRRMSHLAKRIYSYIYRVAANHEGGLR